MSMFNERGNPFNSNSLDKSTNAFKTIEYEHENK